MRRMRASWHRLVGRFRTDRLERDLAEELDAHLQLHIDDNVRAGLTPAEARRRAIVALGGIEQTKEQHRDQRGLPALENLIQDLRFGLRMLRKHPIFTIAAVATLAVGLGSTTAVFTLGNWLVLRPVPGIRDSGQVSYFMTGTPSRSGGLTVGRISYPNYRDLVARLDSIALAAFQRRGVTVAAGEQAPRGMQAEFVTASYFDVLGVAMQAGRPFDAAEDDPGRPTLVAVLSDRAWASMFNRDPAALRQTVTVNGHQVSIIGIADAAFDGARRMSQVDLWLPGASYPIVNYLNRTYDDRSQGGYYEFAARLEPGSTWSQAEAELRSLTRGLIEEYPTENAKFQTVAFQNRGPINAVGRGPLLMLFGLMLAATALILLITCSNVASLLLIRSVGRQSEVAVRRALGGSRGRLVRQHVTEGVLLWLFGGAAGMGPVWMATRIAAGSSLLSLGIREVQIPIDWRVMAFAAGLSFGVGLLFSILPALRAMKVEVTDVLKAGAPQAPRSGFAVGSVLTAVQLAASLTLVVGALLLASTLRHLSRIDLGYQPEGITIAHAWPDGVGYDAPRAYAYYRDFVERLAAQPGVQSAALASYVPFAGSRTTTRVRAAGRPAEDTLREVSYIQVLTPSYFRTLGIQVIRGRPFTTDEMLAAGREASPVVMVSASLARRLFGTIDAIGQQIEIPIQGRQGRRSAVIGVVADARLHELADEPPPALYDPGDRLPSRAMIAVRAAGSFDPADTIRTIAATLDRRVPVEVISLTQVLDLERFEWDLLAWLMTGLSIVASLLAALGVYGLVAFAVAAQRGEFGIRIALGATPAGVRRLVFGRAARLAIAGFVLGLGGAIGLTIGLRGYLVGVHPFDPIVWSMAALSLVAIVLLASWLPARHATRTNVADTLRAI